MTPDPKATNPPPELSGNLLTLWIHQNEILWGRLQTIAAIQAAVLAAWFALFIDDRLRYAGLVALLGAALSFIVDAMIECDLEWRWDIKRRLTDLEPNLFPAKVESVSGRLLILCISRGFCVLNGLLFAVTIITKATQAGWLRLCS